jgi:RNA 2',3'-cyclic 3'-phosphodiesterase
MAGRRRAPATVAGVASTASEGPAGGARRLFVGVPIPAPAREAIGAIVETVRAAADPSVRDVRWVRFDGLHLTLRFLGETRAEDVAGIVAAVDAAARSRSPFRVVIGGAGAFPSIARPRTLWLGVADGSPELGGLAAALDDGLAAAGWPRPDRPFRVHLTLARSDGVRAGPEVARRLVAAADGVQVAFEAASVVLFETIAGGGPARYVADYEARLA